jgi:signal transduction histidine kinase
LRLPGHFAIPDDEADQRQPGPEFDSSPGLPGLAVEVHLANPQLLYGLARQRAWTIGGFTLAGVFAASIGLWAAWRSFQHQLRLSEMKTSFVSSASHELRAPIASIRLMADSLERGKIAEPERQRDYFRIIGQECRRLSALIENVLDFSRIDQGRKQYEFEPGDLAALVRQTLDLMQPYATARKVSLLAAAPPSADADQSIARQPHLLVDSRALQQALVNLIDNAVKHSPSGGAVTVGWQSGPNPTNARLWVQDQGPGIPPQDRERIFEPFHRLGSELERETPGVGIGLSIVKHVVDAHRGRVWVECVHGQGSRFIIDLPAPPTPSPP